MARFTFRLPDVGEGTAEAEIVAWHVAPGDAVEEDQPLVDVMTDKATVEITSPVAGRVLERRGEPGEMFAVGGALVEFETDGAPPGAPDPPVVPSPSGQRNVDAREAPPTTPQTERPAPPAAPSPVNGGGDAAGSPLPNAPAFFESHAGRPLTSPAIRRRAREAGLDLRRVQATGPGGRLTREDFEAHLSAPPPAAAAPAAYAERNGVEEIRVIGLRRKIAEKMAQSKRRIPHFGYVEEVDATELDELRVHLNATKRPDRPKLTLLPFLIRALVEVLPDHPQINATFDDEAGVLRQSAAVHLGMATQTPDGLVVPVIRHAEARDVWALAGEIGRLAKATRDGTATREDLSGSTITLTSLGPLGGVSHTPVINHPEVAIVGPNKLIERPVVRRGQIVARKMMNVSSSFDHRVVDGYDAAEFIQKVKGLLEHPATLFMD